MDKIAISCESADLDAQVDPRFGRAAGFLIVNPETLECQYIENGSSQVMAQGAGIQAAKNVADSGVKVVLTGFVGPKAFQVLNAAGIAIGQHLNEMTARQALEKYKAGEVEFADAPNRAGHGA